MKKIVLNLLRLLSTIFQKPMPEIIKLNIAFPNAIELFVKREDLLHPIISGNKFRKMKYNLQKAKEIKATTLLTFGGAFSNHIVAVAGVGKEYGFQTIGVIRGEELENQIENNPTLFLAQKLGMRFLFVDRTTYRNKTNNAFIEQLRSQWGNFYLLPEGGTNELAILGCEEILSSATNKFDYICTAVGTGGTISGIINGSNENQKIIGFSSLKGDFLKEDISKFVHKNNWHINCDYHFGGYGKVNDVLIQFINEFYAKTQIPLDPIYTGKMMYGVFQMIEKGSFPAFSKILAIHTGGLQGIAGMNQLLAKKNKELIVL